MAGGNANLLALSEQQREQLESWLLEFDRSWTVDRLDVWVRRLPPPGSPLRPPALVEMVKIDLERQWARGSRMSVETYLETYPDLGTAETVPADLIQTEYEVRCQFGALADLAQFAERFPSRAEELRRLIEEARQIVSSSELHGQDVDTQNELPVASTPSMAQPATGARLPEWFGRYRVLRKLGEGGMGSVYLAHDTQLDRRVALKVPQFGPEEGPEVLERFHREARAAATLDHPNLCPVYDVGEIDGIHYLAMAYVEGQPLSEFVSTDAPPDQRKVAAVIRKLALALEEAHRKGVIHRDLKPSNVMINERREPVILDFGLARQVKKDARLTQTGVFLGTPAYMSPEQARGEVESMGPGCDIYSLGVILYELLTGTRPFVGPMAEVLAQILFQEPRRPSELRADLDPGLQAICLKAMAKRPESRYASMEELATALSSYLKSAEHPVPITKPAGGVPGSPSGERQPIPAQEESQLVPRFGQIATPPPLPRRPQRSTSVLAYLRRVPPLAYVLTACAVAGMLLSVVIYIVTDRGTVELRALVEDVSVSISQAGREVALLDIKVNKWAKLRSGEYEAQIDGEPGDLRLSTDSFLIKRGDRVTIEVNRVPRPASGEPPEPADVRPPGPPSTEPESVAKREPPGGDIAIPTPPQPGAQAEEAADQKRGASEPDESIGRTFREPPRSGSRILYKEAFEGTSDSLPDGWRTARGRWTVRDGALAVLMGEAYRPGFAFAPATAWRDYAVQVEMRLDWAAAGLVFRHNEQDRFYVFLFRHGESAAGFPTVQFAEYGPVSGEPSPGARLYDGLAFAQRDCTLSREEYHRVRVEVVGNMMRAYVDGRLVLIAEDRDDVLSRGSVGFIATDAQFKPGIAFFRNLRVEELGPGQLGPASELSQTQERVAAWEFDEGQGIRAKDSFGNENQAQLDGDVKWADAPAGQAVVLNGRDAFIRVPDHPSQYGMKQLTIHVLFQLHSLPEGQTTLMRKWGPGHFEDDAFCLFVHADGSLQFQTQSESRENLALWAAYTKPLPPDEWVEVIANYDGLRNTCWTRIEDGPWTKYGDSAMPTKIRGFPIPDTGQPIEIGCDPEHRVFLHATIDWIRITAER